MSNVLDKIKKYKGVLIVILVIIIMLLLVLFNTNSNGNKDEEVSYDINSQIDSIINNNEEGVVYFYSSDEEKCPTCSDVSDYLKESGISYIGQDIEDMSDEEFEELLEVLDMDDNIFACPAIIYFKDGGMFTNLLNIDDVSFVKEFIDDYNLSSLE